VSQLLCRSKYERNTFKINKRKREVQKHECRKTWTLTLLVSFLAPLLAPLLNLSIFLVKIKKVIKAKHNMCAT